MPSIRSGLRRILRLAARLLWYTFLLTLPLTLLPILVGLLGGVVFHFWSHDGVRENTEAFMREIEWQSSLDYWSVPGAQSIHDFMDNKGPFFIPRLRVIDFVEKFQLSSPSKDEETLLTEGIDRKASLDDLVRCMFHAPDAPTEYWIYITDFPDFSHDPWDEAFDMLLQQSHLRPFPNSTSLYYVDCTRSAFLCGVWGVRRSSLVHISISNASLADIDASREQDDDQEQQDAGESLEYSCSREVLHPATARVIEFPLEDEDAAAMFPRNTLPTPYLQLRTILFELPSSAISSFFDAWNPQVQLFRRFNDHARDIRAKPNTLWHYLDEADEWYADHVLVPLFGESIEDNVLKPTQDIAFTAMFVVSELVRIPFTLGWEIYAWYFGLAWDGEPQDTTPFPETAEEATPPNMFDDMMAGFWDFVEKNMSAQAAENSAHAAVTEHAV